KHEISINQIKKIKENLFPAGGLQERYENILWLNLKYGKGLIQQIIDLCQLDDACLTIVTLDEQSNA
ncbi:MAG: bacillithiol biosynthesis BshC, partial [Bacteroidota bacterium]